MYNKAYNYKNIGLWAADAWADHISPFSPLAKFIEKKETEVNRVAPGSGPFSGRTDGDYNGKTWSNFYHDYIDQWKEKGLIFHSTEMGGVCWTAMLQPAVYNREVADAPLLIVLCSCDYTDHDWNFNNLARYEWLNDLALKENFSVLYICPDGVNEVDIPQGIMQEVSIIWNIRMQQTYLDVAILQKEGIKLADIPGFSWTDSDGNPVNADDCIEDFHGIPVLPVAGRWQNSTSILRDTTSPWLQDPANFDPDKHKHSWAGKCMSKGLALEYQYKRWTDPGFTDIFEEMGADFATHDHKGFQWVSVVPKSYIGQDAEKLPVVMCFVETTYQDPHQIVQAVAAYWNFVELAATGELIFLMFALESADDNDMFMDIVDDAAKLYPVDFERIYVTGQSHNGYFTDEFVRRNHARIAACAPLSNHVGIPEPMWSTSLVRPDDDDLKICETYDMPTILITSTGENHNSNLHCRDDAEYTHSSVAYQRRLKANRCPVPTYEEIMAALHSDDYIRRNIGFPVDRTFLEYRRGTECYIGDVKNIDGKYHLRIVLLSNQTHFIAPEMPELAWEFLRRFKRDLNTGEIVELFGLWGE